MGSEIRAVSEGILLRMGMPAKLSGLRYICDAIELMEADPESCSKVTVLYAVIGKKNNLTGSRVERAIRYAIFTLYERGDQRAVKKYLNGNRTNGNALAALHLHIKREIGR